MSVVLGNGDGKSRPKTDMVAGSAPVYVISADLDRDSKADLIAVSDNSNTLNVYLGNGDGTVRPKADISLAGNPTPVSIVAVDLDGDGVLDLASADSNTNNLSYLHAVTPGTFAAPVNTPVGKSARNRRVPTSTMTASSTSVVAERGRKLCDYAPGKGNGAFGTRVDIPVGSSPREVLARRFRRRRSRRPSGHERDSASVSVDPRHWQRHFLARTDYTVGSNRARSLSATSTATDASISLGTSGPERLALARPARRHVCRVGQLSGSAPRPSDRARRFRSRRPPRRRHRRQLRLHARDQYLTTTASDYPAHDRDDRRRARRARTRAAGRTRRSRRRPRGPNV